MSRRLLTSVGGLAAAIAVGSLLAVSIAAQAPPGTQAAASKTAKTTATSKTTATAKTTGAAKTWSPPRTPWGDPDLQGIYNNATSTPLQRPSRFGGKDVLTDEEAEGLQEELTKNIDAAPRPEYPTGNYNDFWFDPRRREVKDKRTSLITDPSDGRIPPLVPLSPERQRVRAAAFEANRRFLDGKPSDWTEADTALRCISRTDTPPYRPFGYNSNFQIFQGPGYVAIATEMVHSTRMISLDGRPHLGQNFKNWLGDTRGHWEGNTLVLESSNFREEGVYGYAAAGYSTNASATVEATPVGAVPATYHLTERFTRVAPDIIQYEFTVSDPQTWTRPWTAMIPWNRIEDPNHQVFEYACHEDNYDAVHLLTGGRIREKAEENAGRAGSR